MGSVLFIVYMALGYWAVGQTIWANKIIFGDGFKIAGRRLAWAFLLGYILIPWAIIKKVVQR